MMDSNLEQQENTYLTLSAFIKLLSEAPILQSFNKTLGLE